MEDQANSKRMVSIGEASEYLGVSIDTLRRWEKKGRINPLRSPGGHRYYLKDDLDALFGKRYTRDEETVRRTNEELNKAQQSQDVAQPAVETEMPNLTPFQNDQTPLQEDPQPQESTISPQPMTAQPPQEPVIEQIQETQTESAAPTQTTDTFIPNLAPAFSLQTQEEQAEPNIENQMQEPQVSTISSTTPPSILNPTAEESNQLTQEEIERRVNTIVKSEKKKEKSNVLLIIVVFIILAVDAFLLYTWITSATIQSPIP